MRFLFYDRIIEMELGKHAVATRSISVADEFLLDHYSRKPLMPATSTTKANSGESFTSNLLIRRAPTTPFTRYGRRRKVGTPRRAR